MKSYIYQTSIRKYDMENNSEHISKAAWGIENKWIIQSP